MRKITSKDKHPMVSVVVSGEANLFADLVCALLKAALPEAKVTRNSFDPAVEGGVCVSLESTDRWLFVSVARGPDGSAAEALSHGASAVLNLDSPTEDFQKAIDALVRGSGSFVSSDMLRWLAGATLARTSHGRAAESHVRLTLRERQVLHLVAVGLSNIEIGQSLSISANTVRSHLHALSVKLEATSRTRMLANARALGLPEASGHTDGSLRSA